MKTEAKKKTRLSTVPEAALEEAGLAKETILAAIPMDGVVLVTKDSMPIVELLQMLDRLNLYAAEMLTADTRYLINPTGRFVIGGPQGDTGLTGRKIIVDTYGGYAPHGGGAFSGKDPTKVDRSAAYAARHIAKNIVAAGLAKRCEIQLAYAIGVARPVSLFIDTMGTGVVSDDQLAAAVDKLFDLRPNAIIQRLNLRRPIYRANCNYGHFGKADMPWEQLDYVNALRREILE